jgi:predicted nuclease of predicted toxin-antitoxin system
MNLKLGENLPRILCAALNDLGHDVHSVFDEKRIGRPDADIWSAAQREERFLVTRELDFSDTWKFIPGRHRGILLIRLSSPSRSNLIFRLRQIFESEMLKTGKDALLSRRKGKFGFNAPRGWQP